MIVDSHAHLDMPQFDADRADVIRRARDAGLELVIAVGTGNPDDSSIERTLALAENHDLIYAAIGVHPHDARLADSAYWEKLERWAEHPKVVLWGEIGLDYYYDHSPREVQREAFRRQLRMARDRRLPIAVHCRDAWRDLAAILREEWRGDNPGGVLHSFTGDREQAREGAAMGFLISFSGIVTFKKAEELREAARALSLDQILVETDCPYLAPVPHRGKRNEPAFVIHVGRSLADTRQMDFEELARRTSQNIRRLTGLV
jgi:TatD DNase family protein